MFLVILIHKFYISLKELHTMGHCDTIYIDSEKASILFPIYDSV